MATTNPEKGEKKPPVILILGATGQIATPLIPLLLASPAAPTLVLATSKPASQLSAALFPHSSPTTPSSTTPSPAAQHEQKSRTHIEQGSITDPTFLAPLLSKHGVTGIFAALSGEAELFAAYQVLGCARRSGCVRHVVYVSSAGDFFAPNPSSSDGEGEGGGVLRLPRSRLATDAPNVAVKYLIEAKLRCGLSGYATSDASTSSAGNSGNDDNDNKEDKKSLTYTILGPTLFTTNDYWCKPSILDSGLYPQPLGPLGSSRAHISDIALGAVTALLDGGATWGGKKIMIGSRKAYTGAETARLWAAALGRDVVENRSDKEGLNRLEAVFGGVAGPTWGRTLRYMFETFSSEGYGMSEDEYREQVAFLGKEPESYERFVEETAAAWKKE